MDANTHLICDLSSSNGTQLGKLKLIPYKFYSIKDHEPIIFGDVVGMYFKGTEFQNNCVVKMSSQNVDHEASTQILNNLNNSVENIHDLPTQPFVASEEPNIHEAPTQIFSETPSKTQNCNIHDAPTQIFPENKSESLNINGAPNQIFPETNNIHEAETQFFPDTSKLENNIHEAPTQYFKPENDSTLNENDEKDLSNYNINDSDDDATQDDLDPKMIEEVPKITEDDPKITKEDPKITEGNTQNDVEDLLSHTDVYDDIFANESFRSSLEHGSAEIEAVEVDETVLAESQRSPETVDQFKKPESLELKTRIVNDDVMSDDDDIILSTQDSEAIDRKYLEHQEELNSTMDKLDEKVPEEVCDSDATDVEDEQLLIANVEKLRDTFEVSETPEISEMPKTMNVAMEEMIKNDVNDDVSDEEELDLLASTASKSNSSTEEFIGNYASLTKETELAATQLLTTTTTKEAINSSDDETDDELPATQLLHLISKKSPKEKDGSSSKLIPESTEKPPETNDDVYLAATQKLSSDDENKISESSNANKEISAVSKIDGNKTDDGVTQMLPPKVVKTTKNISHKDDSIYSAATQLLAHENLEHDEFEAATQILPLESADPETTKPTRTSKGAPQNNAEENIFSAATQLLPLENEIPDKSETPKNQLQNNDENIFSAATQILSVENELQDKPKTAKSIEEITEYKEDNIFSAATQLLPCPENTIPTQNSANNEIFLAPTQVLLENDESIKKSNDSVRSSTESNEESMRLHLSETEPSTTNINQEEECLQQQQDQQQQNTETQLEVLFELETQKMYVEEKTRRPDNPLSHLFAEEATEQFSEAAETLEDTDIENKMQLKPIVSLVDIKKSKITLKDIQEASTSKIKKSYVKLERIRQEPTRRSNRNAKLADNEKCSPDSEITEENTVEAVENVKTTRRQTKSAPSLNVPEKQDNPTNEENEVKEERTTKRRIKCVPNETSPLKKSQKQDKATNKDIVEAQEEPAKVKDATEEKEDEENIKSTLKSKIMKSAENPPEKSTKVKDVTKEKDGENLKSKSQSKIMKSAENPSENSEEADFKTNTNRHNTRGRRRDYKSISKGELTDENESKNAKGRITSKSFMREKIEELEIHVKEEKPKRSNAKSAKETDSDDSEFLSSRFKRSSRKKTEKETITVEDSDESSIEINIRKKIPKIEDSQECGTRPRRNTKRTVSSRTATETEETKESNLGRSKRVLKNAKNAIKPKDSSNEEMAIEIEDSDESILEKHKKEVASSEESGGRVQTRKRSSPMSPERNNRFPANDICLNTPNSKRRKYEPLSVNISSSQINSDPLAEHKVVFTMLNDKNLENIVQKLGGSVVDSIHVCTVLVTNKISRSLKFLIAVALGKPIVHLKWIMDSEKRKKFLDPWDYLLEDTESEVKFKMSLKESLTTSRNKKLLLGETILLATAKNFEVLKGIV